jgi:arginyl-tRNA synthetase
VGHDTEYVFDFDRMLALSGNTGPYVQYAAARIRSILRKAAESPSALAAETLSAGGAAGEPTAAATIAIVEPAERALALHLLEYGATLRRVGELLEPHRLCGYLFELAQLFTSFYDQCPVLKADDSVRESRLALCALVLHRLSEGLDLLGIETPANM